MTEINGNAENHDIFEQLPEEMKEFFAQLPEETKEKLRSCKSEEGVMDILQGDMIPIPDEILDSVAGGSGYMDCDNYTAPTNCQVHELAWF